MWYENRRRDALAAVSGDDISEDERARLAEEAGMVRAFSLSFG